MEYREEKEKELKEILDLIKEKFPEIKVEINHECVDVSNPYASPICAKIITTSLTFFGYNCITSSKESYLKRVVIQASDSYFMLPFEEKLSGMAHELGHILHDTKVLNPKRLYRDDKWSDQSKSLSTVSEHKAKRLKKWILLKEINADTQAALRGYGEGTLNILKRLNHSPINEARIRNLEKILENLRTSACSST